MLETLDDNLCTGTVFQGEDVTDDNCIVTAQDCPPQPGHLRSVRMHYSEARGPCYARHIAQRYSYLAIMDGIELSPSMTVSGKARSIFFRSIRICAFEQDGTSTWSVPCADWRKLLRYMDEQSSPSSQPIHKAISYPVYFLPLIGRLFWFGVVIIFAVIKSLSN